MISRDLLTHNENNSHTSDVKEIRFSNDEPNDCSKSLKDDFSAITTNTSKYDENSSLITDQLQKCQFVDKNVGCNRNQQNSEPSYESVMTNIHYNAVQLINDSTSPDRWRKVRDLYDKYRTTWKRGMDPNDTSRQNLKDFIFSRTIQKEGPYQYDMDDPTDVSLYKLHQKINRYPHKQFLRDMQVDRSPNDVDISRKDSNSDLSSGSNNEDMQSCFSQQSLVDFLTIAKTII